MAYHFWILKSLCLYLEEKKIDQDKWSGDLVHFYQKNAANFEMEKSEIN